MADREKVIKGLHDLRRYLEDKEWSDNRVDRQAAKVYWQTVTDAIAMLKEQDDKIRQLSLALQIMHGNGIRVDMEGR